MRPPSPGPVRAVLFDMDGVLVFSEDAWFAVYNETLASFGHAEISRAAFDAIYGNGTEADRDTYMPERSVAEIDAAYARFFAARLDRIRPNPEAAETLRALRGLGVATSVATNTNRPLADRILEAQGLLGLVDAVSGADEAGSGKPDPAVVRLAAKRVGASLDACLFVGDSRYDEEAAARAPVRFVGFRHGRGERIESLADLVGLVRPRRNPRLRGRVERGGMPSDWKSLVRETVHSFDRDEVLGMWSVDWRRARESFFEDTRAEIEAEPRRFRRGFLKANAVVYGLARRLAPPRRLVFVVVLVLVLLATLEHVATDGRSGWSYLALFVSVLSLAFLLAMELVDKLHFKDELVMARALQAQLVPRPLPEIGSFQLAGESRVANTVGGDLYAFEALPGGRVVVLFGDASGHGMAAGLVMAVTHAAFRTQLAVDPSSAAMAASLNRVLCETGSSRSFFAGVCGLLEADGTFTAVVAGHPPVLKLDAAGRVVARLGKGAYPLGIRKGTEWAAETTVLAPGETLLFHSDGLPEARGETGGEYGDARVEAVLARKAGALPGEIVAALTADLDRFLGRVPIDDDVSIAAVRRKTA